MDKYLNEDAITAEIMSYVTNRIYNHAVLIDGDWGTGKTYFIQRILIPKLERSGYMPIYISLYGINSTDTVSQKIALSFLINRLPDKDKVLAQKCVPIAGTYVLPLGQTLVNATGLSVLAPLLKSPKKDIPWNTIFKKFSDSRKRIFIFDDLERCSLPINEILGYINGLVEHESEKVLIVANQQAIGKMSLHNDLEAKYQVVLNPQLHLTEKVLNPSQSRFASKNNLIDQPITEFTPDQLKKYTEELFSENVLYKEIKEKLVGQELYFHPTLEKILPHIIAESSFEKEVKEVLTQSLDKIVHTFQQENCFNLRSFQSALLTLSRIWNLNFDKDINPPDRHSLLETLFIAILHSTIQHKRGGSRVTWPEGVSYRQFSYSNTIWDSKRRFLGFKFIEDYIFDSELNKETAVSTINAYAQNEIILPQKKSHDPIQKTATYWLMTDAEIDALYTELSKGIETNRYTLSELIKILSFAYVIGSLDFQVDIALLYEKIEAAVKNLAPIPKESLQYFKTSIFNGSFISSDFPSYKEFREQCINILRLLEVKEFKKEVSEINSIFFLSDCWSDSLYDYVRAHKNSFIADQAFLAKFDPDIIADKLSTSSAQDWQTFISCLKHVYDFQNLNDFYSGDLENVDKLYTRISNLKLQSKILTNFHMAQLQKYLKDIIKSLDPQGTKLKSHSHNIETDTTNVSSAP